MKNIILLSIISLASIATTIAQDKGAKKTESLSIGVKGGLTFPAYAVSGATANDVSTSGLTSFYGGLVVNIPMGNIISIQPGAQLVGKGGSVTSAGTTTKRTPLYLEIPVNLILGVETGPGKILVGAGPYYAFGISGRVKVGNNPDSDITFGTGTSSSLKSTDWGVNFLLGYQLNMGLGINAGYGVGLANVNPNDSIEGTYKSGVFSLGLSFLF